MVRSVKKYMMQVMCTSSQLNDHLKAFIKVLFTALLILYHILPGNIVDAFPTSGCESGLFLHVNPETRTRVCCITVPLPKGFEYVSCEVNGGYDRIAKCPDGLYQVDNTTTASEAKCSSEIECNPDEISFSEQGALTMEGYSDFTWDLDDNPSVPPNEETAVLKLDNQQEQDDMRSEQQPSEETHTKELHQITTNNMEDGNVASEQQSSEETHTEDLQVATNNMEYVNVASDIYVPEDESLYSQFSSGIHHVTNT